MSRHTFNYKAISDWFSTGFFFENNHFYFNNNENIQIKNLIKQWHYSPRNISFTKILNEFGNLIESLIEKEVEGKKIILPLSGGLDSRTLAAALKGKKNVIAFSYEFENGIKETEYARAIAELNGWEFHSYSIQKGDLWDNIIELSKINQCMTEFTHPRQMAVINEISALGDIFLSGSMGDLLFDTFSIPTNSNVSIQVNKIMNLILKPGGIEISDALWKYWNLKGDHLGYLKEHIKEKLFNINISNPSSRIRAFKAIHYVNNWTNINMKIFSEHKPVYAPYHDKEMLEFICTIPENHLARRKIQIEYIKSRAPEIARVPWQKYDLDLYTYKKFNTNYFPRRAYRFAKRVIDEKLFKKSLLIQRNWELQFIGKNNEKKLEDWLFNTPQLYELVPNKIVREFYHKFKKVDSVKYSHPISMLLTMAVWCKHYKNID